MFFLLPLVLLSLFLLAFLVFVPSILLLVLLSVSPGIQLKKCSTHNHGYSNTLSTIKNVAEAEHREEYREELPGGGDHCQEVAVEEGDREVDEDLAERPRKGYH